MNTMARKNDRYMVSSRRTSNECDYDSIARRVKAADPDPNDGRCVVENTSENVQFYHVLPRSLMDNNKLMDSMEWGWNIRRGDLNLDSNVLPVSPHVKEKLESREWILLPDETDLKEIKKRICVSLGSTVRRRCFVKLDKKNFQYKLIPATEFDESIIYRRNNQKENDSFTEHKYPYNDLPTLISHVRPEYVIAAVGYDMMVRRIPAILRMCPHPIVNSMVFTYNLWSIPIDHEANADPTYFPRLRTSSGDSDCSDDTSEGTEVGRRFELHPEYVSPEPSSVNEEYSDESDSSVSSDGFGRKRALSMDSYFDWESKQRRLTAISDDNGTMWGNDTMQEWLDNVSSDCD